MQITISIEIKLNNNLMVYGNWMIFFLNETKTIFKSWRGAQVGKNNLKLFWAQRRYQSKIMLNIKL